MRSWLGSWDLVREYNLQICVARGSFFCISSGLSRPSRGLPCFQSGKTESGSPPRRESVIENSSLSLDRLRSKELKGESKDNSSDDGEEGRNWEERSAIQAEENGPASVVGGKTDEEKAASAGLRMVSVPPRSPSAPDIARRVVTVGVAEKKYPKRKNHHKYRRTEKSQKATPESYRDDSEEGESNSFLPSR